MAYQYKNLKEPANVFSGISDFVLVAPVSDFEANGIKSPAAPFTDPGDEVKVKTAHVFKAGRAFAKILLAPEKNQLSGTTIGDLGFQKQDQTLDIFIPGSYAEVHEFAKNIINTPLVVLTKDSNCPANMWYQLGDGCTYAWAKMDFTTGTTREGIKGYKGTITYLGGFIQLYAAGEPAVLADEAESGS
jgi:hypothetical protein